MLGFARNWQKCKQLTYANKTDVPLHAAVVRRYKCNDINGNVSGVAGCALVLRSLGYLASLQAM